MPLGNKSKLRLATCHPDIQRFAEAVSAGVDAGECDDVEDVTVVCGWRGEAAQNEAFRKGASKLQWPKSKHNHVNEKGDPESLAVDLIPFPVDYSDMKRFRALRDYAQVIAGRLGIKIRIISWDWPHYELADSSTQPG